MKREIETQYGLEELCIERCPKCGHWTPMLKGFSCSDGFYKTKVGNKRYCMLCNTVFEEGLVEIRGDKK